jgi:hypothetical protein
MPRGGKRSGAGAPKGKLNALKHGRRTYLNIDAMALALNAPPVRKTYVDPPYANTPAPRNRRPAFEPASSAISTHWLGGSTKRCWTLTPFSWRPPRC